MLRLYHAEPMANSLKVLIAVHEKQLPFDSRYVNLHRFEQHEPWFVEINPNGQVPVLVHDGRAITESTVINEYLDDVFAEHPLRPVDPVERAHMRVWTKFVDEYFCPALSHIAWHHFIHTITDGLSTEEFEERLERIPLKEQRDKWRTAAQQGFTPEQLEGWGHQVRASVQRMEATLADSPWLAGETYSLADVACYAMALSMPQRSPDLVNESDTPRLMQWHARVSERPGVRAALAMPSHTAEGWDERQKEHLKF